MSLANAGFDETWWARSAQDDTTRRSFDYGAQGLRSGLTRSAHDDASAMSVPSTSAQIGPVNSSRAAATSNSGSALA